MPEIIPQNKLFMGVFNDCQFSRDINGRLDFRVFLSVLDLYNEIIGVDPRNKLELLRKAQYVTSLEEENRSKGKNQQPGVIGGQNKPNLIGKKRGRK